MAKQRVHAGSSGASTPESKGLSSAPFLNKPTFPRLYIVAFVLALLIFEPSLRGPFVFDDFSLPFSHPKAGAMPPGFWIGGVRPLLMATYWGNFLISGTRPFSYHIVNIAIHAATAVLVYFIFARLLEISSTGSRNGWLPGIGAVLFLVHPLQTESVDYIAGRSELVAGFFFAAAWLVFLNCFESKISYRTSLKILCLGFFALLSKESAIALPLILVTTDLFWPKHGIQKQPELRWRLYLPFLFFMPMGAAVIIRRLSSSGTAGFGAGVDPFHYALTECRVILIYLRLFLFPAGQSGDWQLPLFHSFGDRGAWVYCLALIVFAAAAVYLFRRNRLASYGLVVFLLILLPTSSFVPIRDVLAERRTYLALSGLIIAALAFAAAAHFRNSTLRLVAVATVSLLGLVAWRRSAVWANEADFWRDVTEKNPANARAHSGLGGAMAKAGDCAGAVREFSRALAIGDYEPQQVKWNLAEAYSCDNKAELALPIYNSFAASRPSVNVYNRIGLAEVKLGDADAALAAFDRAVQLDPSDVNACVYRGYARLALNDMSGAEKDFRRALDLDPGNRLALKGILSLPQTRP